MRREKVFLEEGTNLGVGDVGDFDQVVRSGKKKVLLLPGYAEFGVILCF